MRELMKSRRQLSEQIQANVNLMTQLTQQQHQNAGGSPAPYSSSDSSASSDEPPRRRRRRTETTQTGAVERTTRDGLSSLPGAMATHLHQGNRAQAETGNLGSGARVEARRLAHQGHDEAGPQDTRLVDRQ